MWSVLPLHIPDILRGNSWKRRGHAGEGGGDKRVHCIEDKRREIVLSRVLISYEHS